MKKICRISILVLAIVFVILATAVRPSDAQQAPITSQPTSSSATIYFAQGAKPAYQEILTEAVKAALRDHPIRDGVVVAKNTLPSVDAAHPAPALAASAQASVQAANQTPSNSGSLMLGGSVSTSTDGGGSGGGAVPAYTLQHGNLSILFGINTASEQTIDVSSVATAGTSTSSGSTFGGALLNPGSNTQSVNLLMTLSLNGSSSKTDSTASNLSAFQADVTNNFDNLAANYLSPNPAADGVAPDAATAASISTALAQTVGDKTGSATTVSATGTVPGGFGLYFRLSAASIKFDGTDPQNTAETKTESAGILAPAFGVQYLIPADDSSGNSFGVEAGLTTRSLSGDVSQDAGFRQINFGTTAEDYVSGELTFFFKTKTATPYLRLTHMPSGTISGFSGSQIIIGTDLFVD